MRHAFMGHASRIITKTSRVGDVQTETVFRLCHIHFRNNCILFVRLFLYKAKKQSGGGLQSFNFISIFFFFLFFFEGR